MAWSCVCCGHPADLYFGKFAQAPLCRPCLQTLFYDDTEAAHQFIREQLGLPRTDDKPIARRKNEPYPEHSLGQLRDDPEENPQ
jgi:hypothetical protein